MALRRTLSKRLFNKSTDSISTNHSPFQNPPITSKTNFHREFLTSPSSADAGFLQQFLNRRSINHPDLHSIPIAETLKEKQRSINLTSAGDRIRLDGLWPPASVEGSIGGGVSIEEVRKLVRGMQLEKVRSALRKIPANSISYGEYVRTCVEVCSNRDQGVEFAKMLDESGNVIVSGNVVFLRPEQLLISAMNGSDFILAMNGLDPASAKMKFKQLLSRSTTWKLHYNPVVRHRTTRCLVLYLDGPFVRGRLEENMVPNMVMEKVFSNFIAIPNDPRREELEQLENQKALIDQKAQKQVQMELYCGQGSYFLVLLGLMRLTFWELSWDVMEPICFFLTSLQFPLACGFFLRASKEPTFEGFSRRRFKAKQKKLMETHKFDVEKYNELCRAFYPNCGCCYRKYGKYGEVQ